MAGIRVNEQDARDTYSLFDYEGKDAAGREDVALMLQALGYPTPITEEALEAVMGDDDAISSETFASRTAGDVKIASYAEQIQRIFPLFDHDCNRKVGEADLLHAAETATGRVPDPRTIKAIIAFADRDADGQLNFDEFYGAITKHSLLYNE